MPIKEDFFKIKPRESSGPRTSDRYDYQKNWSLSTLLEHHLSGSDYLFVFDYHDDMLIFDSEDNRVNITTIYIKGV